MRCDINVSVRPKGEQRLRTRVEIKNMNSLTSMQKAIEFETARQVLPEGLAQCTAWLSLGRRLGVWLGI